MIDDAELLRCYADSRDEKAFAELVRRRIGLVYSVALRRTRDAHRAEDVAQVVFTALARKAAKLARRPVLIGWLYRSAQFAANDAVRTEARRQAREQEAYTMEQLVHDAPEPDWNQLRPVLDEVLNDMDERDRDAVLLRFFDGQPFAEIGAKLQLTENTARMRVERALEKMHTTLARRGITSTTAALATALTNQAVLAAPAGLAAQVSGAALAQAATAGGIAVTFTGVMQLMTTTKTVVGVAAIVGMLAVGTLVNETKQAHTADVAAGALKRENNARAARLQELQRAVQIAETARTDLQKSVADARATAARTNSPVNDRDAAIVADSQASLARGRKFLAAHPEFRSLLIAGLKLEYSGTYGALYRKLGLTLDQIDRFEKLLRETSTLGFGDSAGGNIAFDFATNKYSRTEQEARFREALISETNYAQYLEYSRTRVARLRTTELASALYYTDSALTPEQAQRVEQILVQSDTDYRAGKATGYNSTDWDQVMAQVSDVLSARQLEALNGIRAKALYAQAAYEVRIASLVAARKSDAPAN